MKRTVAIAVVSLLFASSVLGQEVFGEPTQDASKPYRLFSTRNTYTFLKLDTRDGRIWQVQWGDKSHRFTDVLSQKALASGGEPGRFTLYPTKNIFTFILLDQKTGDAWHVQWGKPDDRFVAPIE